MAKLLTSIEFETMTTESSTPSPLVIRDIIALLEKATGPDRELDCEIATLVGFFDSNVGKNWRRAWRGKASIAASADNWKVPSYTASIDAALTLVPKDSDWMIELCDGLFLAEIFPASLGETEKIQGATPAIALCIAALKAKDF